MKHLPRFTEQPMIWITGCIIGCIIGAVVVIAFLEMGVLRFVVTFGSPIFIFWFLWGGRKTKGGSDVSVGHHGSDSGGFFGGFSGGDGGGGDGDGGGGGD